MDRNLTLMIGLLALASGVTVWWMERSKFSPEEFQSSKTGLHKRVLAMELVRNGEEVEEIVGPKGHPNRETMRARVQRDFFFIASYSLLFAALGWLMARGGSSWAIPVGVAIALCAAGAAVFDVIENLRILQLLDAQPSDTTLALLAGPRGPSLIKWALIFVTTALISPICFLRRELFALPWGPRGLSDVFGAIIALAYMLSAVIGLIGLKWNPLIEKANGLMALALLLTVLLLLITFFAPARG